MAMEFLREVVGLSACSEDALRRFLLSHKGNVTAAIDAYLDLGMAVLHYKQLHHHLWIAGPSALTPFIVSAAPVSAIAVVDEKQSRQEEASSFTSLLSSFTPSLSY